VESGSVRVYLASVDDLTVKVIGASSVVAVSSAMVEVCMVTRWGDRWRDDKGTKPKFELKKREIWNAIVQLTNMEFAKDEMKWREYALVRYRYAEVHTL
jgi:hypothetical protein